MSEFERSGTKDRALARTESRVSLALRRQQRDIDGVAVLNGARILELELTTTGVAVVHGLQRAPVGAWVIAGQDGTFSFVWEPHPSNPGELFVVSATAVPAGKVKVMVI